MMLLTKNLDAEAGGLFSGSFEDSPCAKKGIILVIYGQMRDMHFSPATGIIFAENF